MREIFVRQAELNELAEQVAYALADCHTTTQETTLNKPGAIPKGGCELQSTKALCLAADAYKRLMGAVILMAGTDAQNVQDLAKLMVEADAKASRDI